MESILWSPLSHYNKKTWWCPLYVVIFETASTVSISLAWVLSYISYEAIEQTKCQDTSLSLMKTHFFHTWLSGKIPNLAIFELVHHLVFTMHCRRWNWGLDRHQHVDCTTLAKLRLSEPDHTGSSLSPKSNHNEKSKSKLVHQDVTYMMYRYLQFDISTIFSGVTPTKPPFAESSARNPPKNIKHNCHWLPGPNSAN